MLFWKKVFKWICISHLYHKTETFNAPKREFRLEDREHNGLSENNKKTPKIMTSFGKIINNLVFFKLYNNKYRLGYDLVTRSCCLQPDSKFLLYAPSVSMVRHIPKKDSCIIFLNYTPISLV